MSVNELSKYIFTSKYARWIPEKKRRETWSETVERIRLMMVEKYKEKISQDNSILDDINWAYSLMNDKWLVGSQRTTQFAGPAIFKHALRGYNCSATYIDRLRAFQEIMYVLLCGCGAGFSVQQHHVEKLPTFAFQKDQRDCIPVKIYQIPDSIEGWADSIGVLLSSYFNNPIFPEYNRTRVEFDFSIIRPKGSAISSCNGKAPGPAPLRKALENIRNLLDRCIKNGQDKLRPIDAHDLVCYIADSVLSGGVRRASLISLFSANDIEMIKCKTGSWFYENAQRGRANNSAVLLRDSTTFEEFNELIRHSREFGDPGVYWSDSTEQATNPCQPAWAKILTKHGIRELKEISIGDEIWSSEGWTKVINKWSTGIKEIFRFKTEHGEFVGTEDHQVIENGNKIKAINANYIDCFKYLDTNVSLDKNLPWNINTEPCEILNVWSLGEEEVFDITVDNKSHTYWTNGCNVSNCGEIGLYPQYIVDGQSYSGWQVCNLSSINGKKVKSKEDFYNCCKAAAIIGTLQAGFDDFPYLGEISENIIRKEALLGVSICGIMTNPDVLLDSDIQKESAQLIIKTNEEFAKKLGINPAARCTTVKPDGTVSLLFKSSSGIHPSHSRRYFRRVQANQLESIYQHFKKTNPLACESCFNTNNSDDVINFCIEVEKGAKLKNDVSAIELLDAVKLTKNSWVEQGTNYKQLAEPFLRHNVSNTITVKDNEWEEVIQYIYDNRKDLAGISLLSDSGDLDYPQAPFTTVHTHREILEKYGECSLFVSGLIVKALEIFDNNLWKACDLVLGIGENKSDIENQLKSGFPICKNYDKLDWISDMEQFSNRYMDGDMRKLTYLLKEVHNWKYWLDLQREYKKVNYEECIEENDNTKFTEESACAGGVCEIIRT